MTASSQQSSQTRIVLLGTGTPNAFPDRSGPAVAIIVHDRPYLIDFGPGLVRRASAAYQKGIPALELTNLNTAFLTHLHSDHTAGYPDLILTPWVLGRNRPLELYGPPGLKNLTDNLLNAYREDIQFRIHGLEQANDQGWRVNTHEIEPGIIYRDEDVMVEAFPVDHGSWPSYGFRFITPDRTIIISGDTAPTEIMVEKAKGCDVLIHEVYSEIGLNHCTPDWQHYHRNMHTSTGQLAEMVKRAKPVLLILYHQLLWGVTDEDLVREIEDSYGGKVVSGRDLDVF